MRDFYLVVSFCETCICVHANNELSDMKSLTPLFFLLESSWGKKKVLLLPEGILYQEETPALVNSD